MHGEEPLAITEQEKMGEPQTRSGYDGEENLSVGPENRSPVVKPIVRNLTDQSIVTHEDMRSAHTILIGEPEGKRSHLGDRGKIMDLKDIRFEVAWIQLSQNRMH